MDQQTIGQAVNRARQNLIGATSVGDDIWIVAGQSNASGRGTPVDTTNYDTTDPRVWVYNTNGTRVGNVSQAISPIPQHDHPVPTGIGPAVGFARRYVRTLPPNRRIVLVGAAHGGVGMRSSDPEIVGGYWCWKVGGFEEFDSLVPNLLEQATDALAACGDGARIAGVIWVQGESDNANTANYQADLLELIDHVRTQLDVEDLPFVIGQMVPDYITGNRVTIDAIHKDTPRLRERCGFAYGPEGYVEGDGNSHYSAAGQRILASRLAAAAARALTNVADTPPLAPTNVEIAQSGTTLTATWDQPYGRATDFAVQWREGTSGAWTDLTRDQSIDVTATVTGITKGETYQVRVATVNDEGTSAYSTPGEIVTLTDPAQVTGLATGAEASTQIPLTWNAAARATSYLVEYKESSDGSWSTSQTVTDLAATVIGLTPSTSYDFRVSAVNGAGTGTPSSTATTETTAISFLVTDVGVTPARANGIARQLVSGYAGSLIRVRRSSDNTEQDIGIASGVLDTAALLTFAGGGNAFITKVYDQSGNGRDMVQTTQAAQPRIVNAGVVDTRLGFGSGIWDGTDDYMSQASAGAYAAGSATALMVVAAAAKGGGVIFRETNTGAVSCVYGFNTDGAGRVQTAITTDAGVSILSNQHTLVTWTGDLMQVSWVDTGSAINAWTNGAQGTSRNYTRSGTFTLTTAGLGASVRATVTGFANMALSEIVVWHTALTTGQRQAGEANQKAFYGTP